MPSAGSEFQRLVQSVVVRFYQQNAQPMVAPGDLDRLAHGLEQLLGERGLPPPLAEGDPGAPGGLPEAEVTACVARVVPAGADAFLHEVVRQLVKTCFYPEFTVCRDSYRECSKEGACRRQEAERARRRLSGSHCVDCPYWVALSPANHEALLAAAWHGGAEAFRSQQAVFLPEDFRALRRWLWRRARGGE